MRRFVTIFVIIALVFILGAISSTMIKEVMAKDSVIIETIDNNIFNPNASFRDLASSITPAVIHISSVSTVNTQSFSPFNDPFFKYFFKEMPERERKNTSMGSGFICNKDGYIVTNNHVVKNAEKIIIKLQDNREFSGDEIEIIGTDNRTDIAVLKIKTNEDLPYISFGNSDNIMAGDWVMAVGNPYGFDGTVTVGVISAKNRSNLSMRDAPVYQDFIQTDASINPGNSGGPLVDVHGSVIGVNAAIVSPSGGNVGIGFAIPSNMVLMVVKQLIEKGTVTRGYLGIYPQELTKELKEKFGIEESETGVLVAQVEKNTPAEKAGLEEGDIIVSFNSKTVKNVNDFRITVAKTPIEKNIEIVIIRDKKKKSIMVILGKLEDEAKVNNKNNDIKSSKWMGLEAESITSSNKEKFGTIVNNGVIITHINSNSPIIEAGLKIGDVIVKIENSKINNINDYNKAADKYKDKKSILLTVKRGRINIWVVVNLK